MFKWSSLFNLKLSLELCLKSLQKDVQLSRLSRRSLHFTAVYDNVNAQSDENVTSAPTTNSNIQSFRRKLAEDAPNLKDFCGGSSSEEPEEIVAPYLQEFARLFIQPRLLS